MRFNKSATPIYTPPLTSLYPGGADGSGNTDTTAPTVPDPKQKQKLSTGAGTGAGAGTGTADAGHNLSKTPALFLQNSDNNGHGGASAPGPGNGGGNGNAGGNGHSGGNGNASGNGNAGGNGHGNGNAGGSGNGHNGNGNAYGKNKRYGSVGALAGDTTGLPPNYVPDAPDFFQNPIAQATYTYDAVGNRTSMTDDFGTVNYTYDNANRMTQADGDTYKYDAVGNLTSRTSQYGDVNYSYNDDNQLTKVSYADKTYVKYDYDAFGRKVFREEQYYDLNGPGASMGQGNGKGNGNGNAYGQNGDNPNGADHGSSHGNAQPETGLTLQSSGNGNGHNKSPGNGHNGGPGTPGMPGSPTGTISNYQLKTEQTRYLYDGNDLLNEYTGEGNPLMQYYMGADNQVVAQQMFGFQGRKIEGYLGNLRDRGHELFYHYDPTGNVTDLTDHLGSEVLKYRYDAFGGVFTQLWTPYNQVGLTGKSYDIKASLMDYSARWYSPSAGRFTTQDTWAGNVTSPQTLNRYAYAMNNPVNITDPSGHMPCYVDDNGNLRCGYSSDPGTWGSDNSNGGGSGGDNGGGDSGGGYGYGGNPLGGGDGGDGGLGGYGGGGGITPPSQPGWMDQQQREDNFYSAAGDQSPEVDNSPSFGQEFLSGAGSVIDTALGISDTRNAINTLSDPNSGTWDRAGAVGRIFLNVGSDILMVTGVGEVVKGGYLAVKGGLYLADAATTKEVNIEAASFGENGNQEGYIYDGAASSRVTSNNGTGEAVKESKVLWGTWNDYQHVKVDGQDYADIGGRLYTKHAVERMQPSGDRYGGSQIIQAGANDYGRSVSPNYVNYVIDNSEGVWQPKQGTYLHTLGSLSVAVNPAGAVVTVITK